MISGAYSYQSFIYLDCLGMEKERCVLVLLTAVCVSTHTLHVQSPVLWFYLVLLVLLLMQKRTVSDSHLQGNILEQRVCQLPCYFFCSVCTTVGKLLIELCGIALSSENYCFPLRECRIIGKRLQGHWCFWVHLSCSRVQDKLFTYIVQKILIESKTPLRVYIVFTEFT